MEKYINLAKSLIEESKIKKFTSAGVRCLTDDQVTGELTRGAEVRDSYDWDHAEDCSTFFTTGEQLAGACAVVVEWDISTSPFFDEEDLFELASKIKEAVEKSESYIGEPVLLVGWGNEVGEDEDEIILYQAEVFDVL